MEKSLRNSAELKVSATEAFIKEEKIKYHKLKYGEDSDIPEELTVTEVNSNSAINNENGI